MVNQTLKKDTIAKIEKSRFHPHIKDLAVAVLNGDKTLRELETTLMQSEHLKFDVKSQAQEDAKAGKSQKVHTEKDLQEGYTWLLEQIKRVLVSK